MGEEEKKPEVAEGKKNEEPPKPTEDDKKPEESAKAEAEATPAPPPSPPQEIILKVFMHCEGCARKVRRCLTGFPGVEEVITDCRSSKVVVKGEKADPEKVVERVQKKSHRNVELISPIITAKAAAEPPKEESLEKPIPKPERVVITVVLGVCMHCEACAQEIKRRIYRMNGVESVRPDLKSSQVTVKGVIDPEKLADYVYKRTGKHATILKVEPEKKEEEEKEKEKEKEEPKEEKKDGEGEKKDAAKGEQEVADEKKEGGDDGGGKGGGEVVAVKEEVEDPRLELRKHEFYNIYPQYYHQMYLPPYYHFQPRYVQEMNYNNYPPQMFSDENPNACNVM